ncbi:MAG: MFS transporter [Pirellulales bacterium]|nr:MFS transporter [Pirellulales bacterium]
MENQTISSSPLMNVGDQSRRTNYRWVVCGLLFFATTINYVDRAVIGVLKPTLMDDLHWSEQDYSLMVSSFSIAYAFGYLFAGRLIDLVGTRIGYALSVFLWTLAAMAHGLKLSLVQFAMARAALGLAEGGNFPGAVKTVGEWFPKKDRSLATGIFNSGSNIGAMLTPWLVPIITRHYGWRASFVITASVGLVWVIIWLIFYRTPSQHPRVSRAELDYIRSDPPDPPIRIGWLSLLRYRAVWAFIIGNGISSPIWWFYLYWIPGYLQKHFGLDLLDIGPPVIVIYLFADFGSIVGGWLATTLIKLGWSVTAARKSTMLLCALCVVPICLTVGTESLWLATGLVALAAAAHQGWSANLFTMVGDTMPRGTISSVVGLGGFVGAMVSGIVVAPFIGWILDKTGSYVIPFGIASGGYLVALLLMHLILPRLEPVRLLQSNH